MTIIDEAVTAHFSAMTPVLRETAVPVSFETPLHDLEAVKLTDLQELSGGVEATFTGVDVAAGAVTQVYRQEDMTVVELVVQYNVGRAAAVPSGRNW